MRLNRESSKFFKLDGKYTAKTLAGTQSKIGEKVTFTERFKFNPIMLKTDTFKHMTINLPKNLRFNSNHYVGRKVCYHPFLSDTCELNDWIETRFNLKVE